MGTYEREQQLIAEGKAQRGAAALEYFAELDAKLDPEASLLAHRPNYTRTLFNPEHDDIYQEFCRFLDMPEPRHFDEVENPMSVEGFTAADIYFAMISKNDRIVMIDGAAVYNMMVKLRTQPELTKKVLDFTPTCYQGGCGAKDHGYDIGAYEWQSRKTTAEERLEINEKA